MKARITIIMLVLVFAGIVTLPESYAAPQSGAWSYSNVDFSGMYAVQLTGSYLFPSANPLSMLNGPFSLIGTIWADGNGHIKKNLTLNYSGQVYRTENAESVYQVTPGGKYTETYVAPFGKGTVTITYEGILLNYGKEVRLMITGFAIPGIPLPEGFTGMVVSGSIIRQ